MSHSSDLSTPHTLVEHDSHPHHTHHDSMSDPSNPSKKEEPISAGAADGHPQSYPHAQPETEFSPLHVVESRGARDHFFPEAQEANNLEPAQNVAAQAKGGEGKKTLNKYSYHFFSPEMAMFRKIAFKILGGTVGITIIVMWLCLPVYWGSLWKANKYTNKLTVRVIDRDGGAIGSAVSSGLLSLKNLKYFTTSPTEFPTDTLLANDIVDEGAWAAVVINAGTSAALATARQVGDATYNGSSAVSVYYSQARQETAVGSYLLPLLQADLGAVLGQLNAQSVAQYLSANSGNATAITLLSQAPTTITNSIYFTLENLRPYDQPVAAAITLVGLIYMLIFAFVITMTNNAVREIIAPFLTTRAYITYRLLAPLALYLPISFFFAMVNLPFKVSFGAHYTYGGGFFLWWFTLYLGMAAVGLTTEFMITVLGPRFISFFLFPLIISNVSVATLPHDLQPWIYRYGVAMPFYNCNRAVRTMIFNTKNDVAQNLGILLAWAVLNLITITVATWLARRGSVNEHRKEVADGERHEEKA